MHILSYISCFVSRENTNMEACGIPFIRSLQIAWHGCYIKNWYKRKLLWLQEIICIINTMDTSWNYPHRKLFQKFAYCGIYQLKKHYSVCNWAAENIKVDCICGIVLARTILSSTICTCKMNFSCVHSASESQKKARY